MRRSIKFFPLVVVGALAMLALLLMSSGDQAKAAYLTADPVVGSVADVSADMVTTGNTTVLGPAGIQSSVGGIAVAATTTVDIVVDEIAAADGSSGYGLNILFDPSIIQITANSFTANFTGCLDFAAGANPLPTPVLPPGSFSWRTDVGCVPAPAGLVGELVLTRLTVKCLASGISVFDVNDLVGGDGKPDVFKATGAQLAGPATVGDGIIACVVAAPLPADLQIVTETVNQTVPGTVDAGVAEAFNIVKTVQNLGPDPSVSANVVTTISPPADCKVNAAALGAAVTITTPTGPLAFPGPATVMAAIPFSVTCNTASFHTIPIVNTIVALNPVFNPDPVAGNNTVSHTAAGAAPPLTLTPALSPGPALKLPVLNNTAATLGAATITDNLTDNDNAIPGVELVKNEVGKTFTVSRNVTLTAANVFPVVWKVTQTATTVPAGCTATPSPQTATLTFTGPAPQTLPANFTYSVSCSTAASAPSFDKTWTFTTNLVTDPTNIHVVGTPSSSVDSKTVPVIQPYVYTMTEDQASVGAPTGATECLTTLGCRQVTNESMGPADPFASNSYVDFEQGATGYTVTPNASITAGTKIGEISGTLQTGTCSAPTAVAFGPLDILESDVALPALVSAANVGANSVGATFVVRGDALIGGTVDASVDIVVTNPSAGVYRQWRVIGATNAANVVICSGDVKVDMFGNVGNIGTGALLRTCNQAGIDTFTATSKRDDTGGTKTASNTSNCAELNVSVSMTKDEAIGNNSPSGDIVHQGVPTTRNVSFTVTGPPDTDLTASISGPVACAPKWVTPNDPSPSVVGGTQTSVVTVVDIGAGTHVFTYRVNCSPAPGPYSLQIVANVASNLVPLGSDPLPNDNQAENHITVTVTADADGDTITTPTDNCPDVPNPNQNNADKVLEGAGPYQGNACDNNDDNDFVPSWIDPDGVGPVQPFAVNIGLVILDNPLAYASPFGTIGADQCNPGLDNPSPPFPAVFPRSGPDLDNLTLAQLKQWQEDNDDFVAGNFPVPNTVLDRDGCPDTDASIPSVVKDEDYDVNVSQSTTKTVTITVSNGNFGPTDLKVTILAVSRIGQCEVRLVQEPGDVYSEFVTDELHPVPPALGDVWSFAANPPADGVNDTLHSQIERIYPAMAANASVVDTVQYKIHCFQRSTHGPGINDPYPTPTTSAQLSWRPGFELAIDVLPLGNVKEENVTTQPNVHKNFPKVDAIDIADLKITLNLTGPSTVVVNPLNGVIDPGIDGFVSGSTTLHNNGPATGIPAEIYAFFTTPPDCQLIIAGGLIIVPPNSTGFGPVPLASQITGNPVPPLPASITIVNPITTGIVVVECSKPSFHNITTTLIMTPLGVHITDPNQANNTTTFTTTIAALTNSDPAITAMSATASSPQSVNTPFPITVSETLAVLSGYSPVPANLTFTATSVPTDCTLTPPGPVTVPVSVATAPSTVSQVFSATCTGTSNHTFNFQNQLTGTDVHITDTNLANNTATASTGVIAVTGVADVKILGVSVPAVILTPQGVNVPVTASTTIHNNGPLTANTTKVVNVTSATCSVNGAAPPQNVNVATVQETDLASVARVEADGFTVDLPVSSQICTYTTTVTKTSNDPHVIDANGATGNDVGLLCNDSDGDGVANPGAAAASQLCGPPDNCPNAANPNQLDSDGDGLGDVCDPTPKHDVDVKGITVIGPAAINLSDTNGRYMWVLSEIGNFSTFNPPATSHPETVTIALNITPAVPTGCSRAEQLILPGQTTFVLAQNEQKTIVWRVRYECHAPVTPRTLSQTVTASVTHINTPAGHGNELAPLLTPPHTAPNGDVAHHPNVGNTATTIRTIIIE